MRKKISKVLVTGANGAVGSDLVPTLLRKGFRVLATDIDCPKENHFPLLYMDIRSLKQIKKVFRKFKPHAVIHLAAETDVEYCEVNPDHAFETNAKGTKNIAKICAEKNYLLAYVSSVGVFNGRKRGTYNENDKPDPVNVYGRTKLLGERYVKRFLKRYFILRAGWMIGGGEKDKKFVVKILRLIRKGVRKLDVVTDKKGTPTYTLDLSETIGSLIRTEHYGTYHVATVGNPTRFEIAKRILKKIGRGDIKLNPVKSEALKKIYFAPRPANESLDSSQINAFFPGVIAPWTDRLDAYLMSLTGFNMSEDNQKFTIAISLYADDSRFYKDLKKFEKLKYKNFELLIVSDKEIEIPKLSFPTKSVLTGKKRTGIGEKRDYAIRATKGGFIAYIDDDAYPHPDWLTNALLAFKDPRVGVVGGPNMTPPDDPFWAKIGGFIYESYCTSGEAQYRFLPTKKMVVPEIQGVNMIIRKEVLSRLGGFKTKLYSGDDSKICSQIKSLGYEIIYDPDVRVYHHRRPFPFGHLRQVKTMGTHRGFFVKAYPDTLSPMYFLPSLLMFGFLGGLFFSIFHPGVRTIFLLALFLFLLIGSLSVIRRAGVIKSVVAAFGIILTHITYGSFFLYGMMLKRLKR